MTSDLNKVAVRARRLIAQMTTTAGSGHLTSSLSCVDILIALFASTYHFDPFLPNNYYNDRLILSKGHAAPALYAVASLAGWIPEAELFSLRQENSRLEGHPTRRLPFVDVCTGSLGQGLAVGLGAAMGMRELAPQPNVFVLLGDGEMAEGSVWEAMAVASKLKATNLIAIVDCNRLAQSGESIIGTDLDGLKAKGDSFGWSTQIVDGHNLEQLSAALSEAVKSPGPHLMLAKTIKGKGIAAMEDKGGFHAKVLRPEELEVALQAFGPDEMVSLATTHPEKSVPIRQHRPALDSFFPSYQDKVATKFAFGQAVNELCGRDSDVVVIDGDVGNSTTTALVSNDHPNQFIQSYIAESTMVGMATGMDILGKKAIVSTFAAFLTRAFDQLRMAALSERSLLINGSYAGVSIGADGASQMGLEDIAMLRPLPGSTILYPADAYSTFALTHEAYRLEGLVYIRTTREPTPLIYSSQTKFPIGGSHIHGPGEHDVVTIITAGITLFEALQAQAELREMNIPVRVIDAYSIKPLDVATINASIHQTRGRVVVVEDHRPEGGLGEAVLSAVADSVNERLIHLAVRGIPHSATPEQELARHEIDASAIMRAVQRLI